MFRTPVVALLLSLPVLSACGTGASTVIGADVGVVDSSGEGAQQPEALAEVPDRAADPDSGSPDLTLDVPLDIPPESRFGCTGAGCFLDPCKDNADCQTGLCVQHLGNSVCSMYCLEDCPDGWSCRQVEAGADVVFACFSQHSHLCLPCGDTSDCSGATVTNACIVYPGQGTFCGAACDAANLCPEGYVCKDAFSTEGTATKQCVASEGVCECSGDAVALALSTPCVVENEIGACSGLRICTEGGLAPCDASTPAPDVCNGLDDDCDGAADEDACDDLNPCTQDTCDPLNGCTHAPLSDVACDDGDSCSLNDTCKAGACAGTPIACNDGNPCTDDVCDGASGCQFPFNTAPCDDGDPCTLADACKQGACASGPKLSCDDGNPCTADQCDPAGGCIHTPQQGPCDDGNPCTTGDACSNGQCAWAALLDCDDGNLCTTDACEQEAGCVHLDNTLPCDDASLCTVGDKCSMGQCAPGKPVNCDDSNPCTDDTCNPLVGCVHVSNASPCDDLDPCTTTDACTGGACVGTGVVDCDDGQPCTDDFCVPMAGCSHKPNVAPCSDSSLCTVGDKCLGGVCLPGPEMKCDDGNVCTADSCAPASGCLFTPAAGLCDDLNACTTDDHCDAGKCVSSQPLACDDANPCTTDTCLPGGGCSHTINKAPCDDGDPCTAGDTCAKGVCVPGPEILCNDGNPCTKDACANGACTYAPAAGACDDGNPCTAGDTCSAGTCAGKATVECDDGDVCTTDYCDPAAGCVHKLNTAPCNDGNVCTLADACTAGQCKGTGTLACNDGNPCTTDSCDPEAGCVFKHNANPCDDMNQCTVGDHCAAGACVADTSLACSDGNACTVDSCLPASGCAFAPGNDGAWCNDGNACTLGDQCAAGDCKGTKPVTCTDNDVCTKDTCNPATGCVFPPDADGIPCNDGNACTVTDACAAGKCAGSGTPNCDDGKACTTDACNPASGCTHALIAPCCGNGLVEAGEQCDDGNNAGGDGCSASCTNESPCPADVAYVQSLCWVKANAWQESHSAACARIGKTATAKEVSIPWDNSVLLQVASKWGYTSIGDFENSAHAMWCNNAAKHCGTHNWGTPFDNYGPYGDSNYWPVYTCKP